VSLFSNNNFLLRGENVIIIWVWELLGTRVVIFVTIHVSCVSIKSMAYDDMLPNYGIGQFLSLLR
jgi:hypothetical protein